MTFLLFVLFTYSFIFAQENDERYKFGIEVIGGLSTLFLSHSYFATDKMIRLNSEYIFILKANSKRDLQMVVRDFNIPNLDEKKIIELYNDATKDKGQTLFIDNVKGQVKKNFDEVYKL